MKRASFFRREIYITHWTIISTCYFTRECGDIIAYVFSQSRTLRTCTCQNIYLLRILWQHASSRAGIRGSETEGRIIRILWNQGLPRMRRRCVRTISVGVQLKTLYNKEQTKILPKKLFTALLLCLDISFTSDANMQSKTTEWFFLLQILHKFSAS